MEQNPTNYIIRDGSHKTKPLSCAGATQHPSLTLINKAWDLDLDLIAIDLRIHRVWSLDMTDCTFMQCAPGSLRVAREVVENAQNTLCRQESLLIYHPLIELSFFMSIAIRSLAHVSCSRFTNGPTHKNPFPF